MTSIPADKYEAPTGLYYSQEHEWVSGQIIQVNEKLMDSPELVNKTA